jgi:heat-inducible transcriptional repressor
LFVDQLATVKPLTAAEKNAMSILLDGAMDLDDIVIRAVRALASLTHQVALVQYPSLRRSALRRLEIVDLGAGRTLVVIITENGRVEQRVVSAEGELTPESGARLRARLNEAAAGRRLAEAAPELDALAQEFAAPDRPTVSAVVEVLVDVLQEGHQERLVLAGAANLSRSPTDFPGSITPVLEAIEEQVVLLKLLSELAQDTGEVAIRIGHENAHSALAETSMVATGYGPSHMLARLGVLGPTRMDYPSSIAVVRAIARYLSRILAP